MISNILIANLLLTISYSNSCPMQDESRTMELLSSSLTINASQSDSSSSLYVETPMGSQVEVLNRGELLSDVDKTYYINQTALQYPNATLLGEPTTKYNCHSYAWYMDSTENSYWMNDPTLYFTDGSYTESFGEPGDKIVYFKENVPIHSGIVESRNEEYEVGLSDLENVQIRSKRGSLGLYLHKGSETPYTETTSIKYYKLTHIHSYETYIWKDLRTHFVTCECGMSYNQGHFVAGGSPSTSSSTTYFTCLRCNGPAIMGFILNENTTNFEVINSKYYIKETAIIDGITFLSYNDYLRSKL